MADLAVPLDMAGIDARWYARIPQEDQERLVAAFPDMRIVWNEIDDSFQTIVKDPESHQLFNDGRLDGWIIVATFKPPLSIDYVINLMRRREKFIAWKLREMGYGTESDSSADVVNAYLNDADRIVKQASEQLWSDAVDDYMDGAVARGRDEKAIYDRWVTRARDQAARSRAHSHTRLVVPVRSVNGPHGKTGRYILEKS